MNLFEPESLIDVKQSLYYQLMLYEQYEQIMNQT